MGPSCKQPGTIYDTRTNEGLRATYEEGAEIPAGDAVLRQLRGVSERLKVFRDEFERRLNGLMGPICDAVNADEMALQMPPYFDELRSVGRECEMSLRDLEQMLKAVDF